ALRGKSPTHLLRRNARKRFRKNYPDRVRSRKARSDQIRDRQARATSLCRHLAVDGRLPGVAAFVARLCEMRVPIVARRDLIRLHDLRRRNDRPLSWSDKRVYLLRRKESL